MAERAGFHEVRWEGNHNTFRNAEGRVVVIPDQGFQVIVRILAAENPSGHGAECGGVSPYSGEIVMDGEIVFEEEEE